MADFKILEIKQSVYADNDKRADLLREELKEKKLFLLNLMSSPGSGKTTTLMRTIEMLKDEISEVLLTLTEREEKVVRLRFGLEDGKPRTLEEVGQMFGVTRERIRQIEAKALRKLRHPSRSRKLRDYMEE